MRERTYSNSRDRLESLDFDPIVSLVNNHKRITEQLVYYDNWRDGILIPLNSDGKPRYYNAEVHMNLYDKLSKISESLLRYGYGRVSEVDNTERNTQPIVINLTTNGETFHASTE